MAIEDVVVCFYSNTAPSVSGKTINAYNSGLTAGTLDSDLSGYDTGAATGISFDLASSRTISTNGRLAGADTLTQEVNRQGAYHDGGANNSANITDYFTVPATVSSVDVEVYLCTPFTLQDNLDVVINGTTAATNFDSTNNTTGATVTLTGVVPDGSDRINIYIDDDDTSGNDGRYIFVNGYRLYNIVESGGLSIPVAMHHYKQMRS